MEKKQDLRVKKTYKALTESFISLLEKKTFEEITVAELCERAMVRRATFYKHFLDKYDFFHFFIREMQAHFESDYSHESSQNSLNDYFLFMAKKFLEFLNTNKKIVNQLKRSKMILVLFDMISKEVTLSVEKLLISEPNKNEASIHTLACFYTGGFFHVIQRWVLEDRDVSGAVLMNEIKEILDCAV